MNRPKRIFLIELNRDGTPGGSYRSLLYLVKHLDRTRFTPMVAFYRDHPLLDEFRRADCQPLIVNHPTPLNLVKRFPVLASPRLRVVRPAMLLVQKAYNFVSVSCVLFFRGLTLFLKNRIDLVHLNNGVAGGAELLVAAKVLGIKCTAHQRGIHGVRGWQRRLSDRLDHIVCVSDAARDNLIRHGIPADKCTTVHNGMDPEEFYSTITRTPDAVRSQMGIAPGQPVIGMGAMLKEWKGQLVLVKAMLSLRAKYPAALCLLVGGVSDRGEQDRAYLREIEDFIRQHALEPNVRIVGYEKNVGELLQIFDVMVHASIDPEPFSRVVLEGMLLGRAIVGTRTGGTVEQLEDRVSGLLVEPNEPSELADKIDELLRHPELRAELGRHARERLMERFLIRPHVDGVERIFERVLANG